MHSYNIYDFQTLFEHGVNVNDWEIEPNYRYCFQTDRLKVFKDGLLQTYLYLKGIEPDYVGREQDPKII